MQVKKTIPLFPLGLVLLPQTPLPLHIFEERYKIMIGECLKQNKRFGIVYYNGTDIQTTGCTASILKILKRYDDGRLDILTRGEDRFVIQDMYDRKPFLEAKVAFFDDEEELNKDACQVLADKGMNLIKQFTAISGAQDSYSFDEMHDFKSISFLIAGCDGFSKDEKQRFLEMSSTHERLKKSVKSLEKIMDRIKITLEIRNIIGGNGNMTHFSAAPFKLEP
ncbi:MAG: LON peptidase substrate-binding domain-containing protein [Deltaproteobacteria bacterium]|nr:LON peptidase substrate-binding domain-containing protein [Deltaproteobacteria bacterium]